MSKVIETTQSAQEKQDILSAQVGVLGSMLIDEGCIGEVLGQLTPQDFREPKYRAVFQAIGALFREALPVTPISVREKLGGQDWTTLLVSIMEATATAANVEVYTQLLKESVRLCRLRELGAALGQAGSLEEAGALVDKAMNLQVSRPGIHALGFQEGYTQFLDRHGSETPVDALEWDVQGLNKVLQVTPGNMVVIGGYPSDGKTALALQCAARFGQKHRVAYFTFESTVEQLFDRYVSRIASLSSKAIANNDLTEENYRKLLKLKDTITAPQVTLVDAAGMNVLDIQAYSQANHFDVVLVDYLQKVAGTGGSRQSDFERVSEVSSQLQAFAKRTKTRVVALSQLSRPMLGKDGTIPPPAMSSLRSSGQIEQDADVVLLLFREDYGCKDANRVIHVAKNRNGEAFDKVRCRFDGDYQQFTRIAEEAPVEVSVSKGRRRRLPRQVALWPGEGQETPEELVDPFARGAE